MDLLLLFLATPRFRAAFWQAQCLPPKRIYRYAAVQ
jgi:hypothetical protein